MIKTKFDELYDELQKHNCHIANNGSFGSDSISLSDKINRIISGLEEKIKKQDIKIDKLRDNLKAFMMEHDSYLLYE